MVPVKYVNESDDVSAGNTILTTALFGMAAFAMYQIYKGRGGGAASKGSKSGKDAKKGS